METIKITQIAQKAGITQGYLSNILIGNRRPSWNVSEQLEKVTGIPAVKWIKKEVTHNYLESNYRP